MVYRSALRRTGSNLDAFGLDESGLDGGDGYGSAVAMTRRGFEESDTRQVVQLT